MATTALFVEVLIIGLQVEAWLALAVLSAFGTDWVELAEVKDFASLVTILVLALAYVLGIVADRVADTLVDRLEKTGRGKRLKRRLSKRRRPLEGGRVGTMRMRVMHESEGMAGFLDYQRSRWRIARATVLNLALAGPLAGVYVGLRTDHAWPWALVPPGLALVLIPVAYFAAVRIQDAWVGRLEDAYGIVTSAGK